MVVLAIDLGGITGYAYVHSVTSQFETGLLRYGTIKLGAKIPAVKIKPDVVVIERPAFIPGPLQVPLEAGLAALGYQFYKNVHIIRAADWKPRFKNFPLPARGVLPTQHEKDAYRMAHWALEEYA